ncbi:MAG: DUF255 domain-containing protein [Phycisphaerae bacterium]|nr:DUF255 domain-containing protein [Phycisphaerae bacterium]
MTAGEPSSGGNRLAAETSPYLLQHARNPVDWYPWGPEAFERARREDKPIFLSVGYSSCYWCHVMERQSFQNPAVAAVMNQHFVNIKVDREERPDVDQLYMTGVQIQTRHGGWPMSVFLTPDLQYFYGGTYFPPRDAFGRPGFLSLLTAIADAWRNRREEVNRSAADFTEMLRKLARTTRPPSPVTLDARSLVSLIDRSTEDFDYENGGYGAAPKFPRQTLLELILEVTREDSPLAAAIAAKKPELEYQLTRSLNAMMYGGLRDQLGGAFHRYATDARWQIPHFEIMLYDNAMLGWIYAEASQRFQEPRYLKVARRLFDFILREMTSPDGAFYTAFDAEVDAQEGLSYLWTRHEVESLLNRQESELFCRVYGLDQGPNFGDPHAGGIRDKNVLFVADQRRFYSEEVELAGIRSKLLSARARRKQPLLDTKIITSWNALMIRALAHAGKVLKEPRYLAAAEKAARFLLEHHRLEDGTILRCSRDGAGRIRGFLDDYAFLAHALLALHAATGDEHWRQTARQIAIETMRRFHDDQDGGFFFSDASADDLIIRQKVAGDSPLPAGAAVAARVSLELGDVQTARRTVEAFTDQVMQHAGSMSAMIGLIVDLLRLEPAIHVAPAAEASRPVPTSPQEPVLARAVQTAPDLIEVSLRIEPGWHIQANPASSGLTATALFLPVGVEGIIEYPEPLRYRAPFADREISVYSGEARITVKLGAPVWLVGTELPLTYQACSDQACLAPRNLRVRVENPPRF